MRLHFLFFNLLFFYGQAQTKAQAPVRYLLDVDTAQHVVNVEMRLQNKSDTFRLAMYAHPEYDDRFWRYVKNLAVENGTVLREDSALWQIRKSGSKTIIRYTVQWPQTEGIRPAWKPFLSATGALLGGPHFYLYAVGKEDAPAEVKLNLPANWQAETALQTTKDSLNFFAPNVATLVDAPILVGNLKKWTFSVDNLPHTVAYWYAPAAQSFSEDSLVDGIKKIVQQTKSLFGSLPYKTYKFLLMDDAYGALEHATSVTLGLETSALAKDASSYFVEIAHEYFHAWNLVRIHPVAFDWKVRYKNPPLAKELWWSEGVTMFYADLLLRRAGLPGTAPSRIDHLKELLTQYYNSPGNYNLSPETVSVAENAPNGLLGDYSASAHLQGELIGVLLDAVIRDKTGGKKSLDDVMRKMAEGFSGEKGFLSTDVEKALTDVCSCNVHPFFANYVYKAGLLPFNDYLQLIGLKTNVEWKDAVDDNGKPLADLNVYAWQKPSSSDVLIGIISPTGLWGRAGLHTGDVLLAMDNLEIKTPRDFFGRIRSKRFGDTVLLLIKQKGAVKNISLLLKGYKQATVSVVQVETSPKQLQLREAWMKGKE